ncbi:MAG: hypothetical protein Q4B22_04010 [Eubacteriales bacterium]|nr:hypothetical protein [Eubacteriales bacterium]
MVDKEEKSSIHTDGQRKGQISWNSLDVLGIVFVPLGFVLCVLGLILGIRNGGTMLALAFSAPGLPFLVLGVWFVFVGVRQRKAQQDVLESADYVLAVMDAIEEDTHCRSRKDTQYYVRCSYVDPAGKKHVFTSRNLTERPDDEILGHEIRVYVNPGDYSVCFVDINRALEAVRKNAEKTAEEAAVPIGAENSAKGG